MRKNMQKVYLTMPIARRGMRQRYVKVDPTSLSMFDKMNLPGLWKPRRPSTVPAREKKLIRGMQMNHERFGRCLGAYGLVLFECSARVLYAWQRRIGIRPQTVAMRPLARALSEPVHRR